jgi:hypothetical protein
MQHTQLVVFQHVILFVNPGVSYAGIGCSHIWFRSALPGISLYVWISEYMPYGQLIATQNLSTPTLEETILINDLRALIGLVVY